jgi:putative ABC transport system permease protein
LPIKSYFEVTANDPESWRSNYVYTYVKLHKGADLAVVNEKHVQFEKELTGWNPESGKPYEQYFFYQPIKEIHLYSHRKQELEANSSIKNVYIYSSIGLLILIIAGINYINLATAMSVKRQREIGIKKTLGANKKQLVNLFLTESVIVAFISTALAALITISFLSYFGNLMARDISISIKDLPYLVPALLLLAITFGLIAGLIPSRSMSNFSVISIIRDSPEKINGKFGLRNVLVVTQFVVALVLIIVAINIQQQLNLILKMDPGYSKEQILTIPIFDKTIKSNMVTIKEQLLNKKNILNVSSSYMLPHKINEFTRPQWFCDDPTECTPISYCVADYNFIDLYDIEIVDGRNFSKDFPSDASGAFLLNEKAVKMLGWDSAIGKEITHYNGAKGVVVGVVKDFNFESFHTPIGPLYIMLNEKTFSFLSIKIKGGDIPETIDGMKSVFDKFSPGTPFNFTFFDEEFEQVYNGEKRTGSILIYFSVLAILLGCLGLFGLSAFTIGQKTKEIGVRKVFGALNLDINLLFTKSFISPVFFANLIAWPVAYYAVSKWLESFAYKINITVCPFIISTVIVLVITSITINLHSKKVAGQTPAECLRH